MWIANGMALGILHPKPLTPFHFVIAPRRHVRVFYDLDVQEQGDIWLIIRELQKRLADVVELTGVDIGFEDGQSDDDHAHVHVVPRTPGRLVKLPLGVEWVAW